MNGPELGIHKIVSYTHKTSCESQIHSAIDLFNSGSYAPAITLALAAEEQLPDTDEKHALTALKEAKLGVIENTIRNWLKHHKEPNELSISEVDAINALLRSCSKYVAVYKDCTPQMNSFFVWCKSNGYLSGA